MSDQSTVVRCEPFDRFSGAHLAAAGFLTRYSGRTRDAYAADLRGYLAWCATGRLDVFAVARPHIELYVRWLEEDPVTSRLGAQKDSQAALVGRAKDLLGTVAVAGTILGLLANDHLFKITTKTPPAWWLIATGAVVAVAVLGGLWVMLPRSWSFATDPADLAGLMAAPGGALVKNDWWYESLAQGYLTPQSFKMGLRRQTKSLSQLDYNASTLGGIARVVYTQALALAVLVALAFALLLVL